MLKNLKFKNKVLNLSWLPDMFHLFAHFANFLAVNSTIIVQLLGKPENSEKWNHFRAKADTDISWLRKFWDRKFIRKSIKAMEGVSNRQKKKLGIIFDKLIDFFERLDSDEMWNERSSDTIESKYFLFLVFNSKSALIFLILFCFLVLDGFFQNSSVTGKTKNCKWMANSLRCGFKRYRNLVNLGFKYPKCTHTGMLELIQGVCSNPDISVMQGLICVKSRFNKEYDGFNRKFMDYGDFKFHENNQTVTLNPLDHLELEF